MTVIRSMAILMAAALVTVAIAANAQATLIATDSYIDGSDPTAGEYDISSAAAAQLKNQPANLANLGFVNGPYAGGTGTGQFQADSGNLGGTLTNSTGGKVKYNAAPLDGIRRSVARNLATVTETGPFYISHTVNRGGIPEAGGDGYALTGIGNFVQPTRGATSGFLEGLFVGFTQNSAANPTSFGDLVIRARTTAAQTAEDIVLVDGASTSTSGITYTVVMKVDINSGGGSGDPVTWWLNPTSFADDTALTSSAAATGSFGSFAFGGTAGLNRLNYDAQDWNGNVFFDEVRLSTTSAELVPEPTSLALLALGGLVLANRRRRKA